MKMINNNLLLPGDRFWTLALYAGSLEFPNYCSKLASIIIKFLYGRTKTEFVSLKGKLLYFGLN
jgi:hypothetical protein